jgi:Acyl-CoA carboxylase epsilon subunit
VSGPLFHVKRGDPTPEELAALTAVLAAKARAATAARSRRRSAGPPPWGSPAAAHRRPLPAPGPGAWKRAARVGMGHAGWVGVGHGGGGLWTTEDPPSAAGLPSRIGGPGSRGSGSGVPWAVRVTGTTGTAGTGTAGAAGTAATGRTTGGTNA